MLPEPLEPLVVPPAPPYEPLVPPALDPASLPIDPLPAALAWTPNDSSVRESRPPAVMFCERW
jgi:hypothetical protein